MSKKELSKIVVVVGPTASGKSALAIHLAKKFNGEVISADSRQVYKGLDIGTEKLSVEKKRGVPHHLIDIVDPQEIYTAQNFKKDAGQIIRYIVRNRKLPIVAGGTGFYIQALVDNIDLPKVPPSLTLCKSLEQKTTTQLLSHLRERDSVRADSVDPKNRRRLIRAIEIAEALGSVPPVRAESPYNPLFIGLTADQGCLKSKISVRLQKALDKGLIEETQRLTQKLSRERVDELGLEYRIVASFLRDEIAKDEMVISLQHELWHYAKRQMTWFRRDKRIEWFDPADTKTIDKLVEKFLDN